MVEDSKRVERDEVRLWLADSDDSIKVAKQNFELGNYHVAAFFVHSAVERALKAAIIALKLRTPPKTHNLKQLYLEVVDQIELSEEQVDFLAELTPASQTTRYVDISMALPRDIYSRRLVKRYFSSSRPILGAIRRRLKA